jgi:xanthine dehydrogenase accessory factor
MQQELQWLAERLHNSERVAMCVVVRSRGSTPQKVGAAMVVRSTGETVGTLGGGCVEAETKTRAILAIESGRSELLSFKLDHDYGWDDGMVCGGNMDIAVRVMEGEPCAREIDTALSKLKSRHPATLELDLAGEKFEIPLEPSPRLVIAGAGHVSMAVASAAKGMGFEIVVIDDRPEYACAERFPGATCVVGKVDARLQECAIDTQTYVLIVTRGHRNDADVLAAVIGSDAKYIGLIGSKRKVLTILRELLAGGATMQQLQRVYSPVGLDIGAITPAEIAVSILAELIATRRGAAGAKSMRFSQEDLRRLLDERPTQRD